MPTLCASLLPGTPLAALLLWPQHYDPTHHWILSTACAALPLVALLACLLGLRLRAHLAALAALAIALAVATGIFHMPPKLAALAAAYGAAYGLFPIFWIIFPVIFLYRLTIRAGRFHLLQETLVGVTQDSRLQLLLIAFAFGAFFEGVAGFGAPVAVCGTILLGIGFSPLQAAGLTLLANTAPVAFGSLGIPVIALHGVTGLDTLLLTRVVSSLLAPFCVLIPFWLIWAFAGFRRMIEIWPAILLTGLTYATTLYLMAHLNGPWLVDITASLVTLAVLILFLRVWRPSQILNAARQTIPPIAHTSASGTPRSVIGALIPWFILAAVVACWGTPAINHHLDAASLHLAIPGLDRVVLRIPPAAPAPTPEPAVFNLNWLAAAGTGIFLAALLAAAVMRLHPRAIAQTFWECVLLTRFTAITIAALMGLGFITRFCGLDATLGLAFARTGIFYPFFGTFIGWLGTASTGSDTSSNVLFGSLQKLTAQQLNISPYVMTAANSAGGVMGKMVAPQSVVVASTATGIYGKEGSILRFVLLHSLALAALMGLLVSAAVYTPFVLRLVLR